MTDNVIRYDPDTDEVIYPDGDRRPGDDQTWSHATAMALHEAEKEIERLSGVICGMAFAQDLPLGVAPHPSLPEGEYLALGKDVRNLPDDEWQWRVSTSCKWGDYTNGNYNANRDQPYIVRRIPATKRVPLHRIIGERLPAWPSLTVGGYKCEGGSHWATTSGCGLVSLTVADDGTVEVLA